MARSDLPCPAVSSVPSVLSVRGARRARLCLFAIASALLLGACASGSGGSGGSSGSKPAGASAGSASSNRPGGSSGAASKGTNGPNGLTALIGPFATLRCGKQEISVRANAEQAELNVGAKRYLLQAQRSASGARFASTAYPGTSFWSKGDRGMLMVDGRAFPECAPLAAPTPVVAQTGGASAESGPPSDLTVREWVVESIDGRSVVDNSRTTLVFDQQGQISGRAGCNRYTGSFQLQGASFEVRGMSTTRMICVLALMEQEARFLAVLAQARAWQLQRDGSLVLRTDDQRRIVAR